MDAPTRHIPNDFVLALVTGFVTFFAFGAASLVTRPIPADIYPTFAFRPEDGPAVLALFLAVNMAAFASLAALAIGLVAWLVRVGRRRSAVALATVLQVGVLAGSVVGGSGAFVRENRWVLLAALVLGSGVGFTALGAVVRRLPPRRHLVALGAGLAVVLAVDFIAVSALGNFANLYGMVFVWLAIWTLAGILGFVGLMLRDLGGLGEHARRGLYATAALLVALAVVDATGLLQPSFLHVRRVYDWRCPEAAAFVNLRRTAMLDVFKLQSALRSTRAGAAIDTTLLAAAEAPQQRWHVVFFVVDALRRDRVPPFNPEVETPHLRALAAESTVFRNAYSPAPTTGYSIVSFLSGVLPHAAVQADGPPIFLPYVLRHFGWHTGASASFDGLHDMVPVLAGFTSDDIGFTDITDAGVNQYHPTYDGLAVDALADRLEAATAPRFEYIHLFGTHGPFRPPDSVAKYDAAVREADAQLGRLRARLEAAGLWERTLFVVFGDHGEGLGEHGMYAHSQSLYVEQTAVPLFVRIPGGGPAERPDPVTLNILPTVVMEALGGGWPVPTAVRHGDVVLNEDAAVQEFHIRSELVWRAIRQPPWSFHHRVLDRTVELYDLSADPGESRDIAPEHPDVVARFRALESQL